jgi:hypothetical protein
LPPSFQPFWPGDPSPRRFTWVFAWVGLLLAAACLPGFGAVVGSADSADVFVGRRAVASTGVTLDNALVAHRTGAQDSLDLLLQMPTPVPGSPDGLVAPPRAGLQAAAPRAPAAAGAAARAEPSAALAAEVAAAGALLGTEAGLPLPQFDQQRPARDWALAAALEGGGNFGGGNGLAADGSGSAVSTTDPRALQQPLLQLAQLLRDNRAWLLGGLLLLLLLGAAIKGFSRRI